MVNAAEYSHDQYFGGFGPIAEIREDASVEDPEQATGEARKTACQREHDELIESNIRADELGTLWVVANGGEHASEGRFDDPVHPGDRQCRQDEGEIEEFVIDPEIADPRDPVDPCHAGHRYVGIALLAAGHIIPLEADGPHDLGERHGQHGEIDGGEPHAEETKEPRKYCASDAAEHPSQEEGDA